MNLDKLLSSFNWPYYLLYAYHEAVKSKDPSTQNGALLVDLNGYILLQDHNRFPAGLRTDVPERWEKPLKYELISHAERAVICQAAKRGVKTDGLIMVCPWAACNICAQMIVDSGIKALITHKQALLRSSKHWLEKIELANKMLTEADVRLISIFDSLGGVHVLHNGELWTP